MASPTFSFSYTYIFKDFAVLKYINSKTSYLYDPGLAVSVLYLLPPSLMIGFLCSFEHFDVCCHSLYHFNLQTTWMNSSQSEILGLEHHQENPVKVVGEGRFINLSGHILLRQYKTKSFYFFSRDWFVVLIFAKPLFAQQHNCRSLSTCKCSVFLFLPPVFISNGSFLYVSSQGYASMMSAHSAIINLGPLNTILHWVCKEYTDWQETRMLTYNWSKHLFTCIYFYYFSRLH